jgi:hypothetical protein
MRLVGFMLINATIMPPLNGCIIETLNSCYGAEHANPGMILNLKILICCEHPTVYLVQNTLIFAVVMASYNG